MLHPKRSPPRTNLPAAALAFALSLGSPLPAAAADDEFKVTISNHKFQPEEVAVPAGKKFKLIIDNRDPTPEEFQSHPLKREKVIAGKSTGTVMIGPLQPGRYPFVGKYNVKTAMGMIVAK
jgi:hypothetical protein